MSFNAIRETKILAKIPTLQYTDFKNIMDLLQWRDSNIEKDTWFWQKTSILTRPLINFIVILTPVLNERKPNPLIQEKN